MPGPIGKLVTPPDSANESSAFLFQPQQLVPFAQAWQEQRCWQEGLLAEPAAAGGAEAVWLLQHSSCYTLGRGASEAHLRFDPLRLRHRCTALTVAAK